MLRASGGVGTAATQLARTAGLTVDCLRSLAPEVAALGDCRVTVVDGGSADGSAEKLADAIRAEGWSEWVELLPLAENRGFAAGNNAATNWRNATGCGWCHAAGWSRARWTCPS